MPGEAPTFTTLNDIANLSLEFKNDCQIAFQIAQNRLERTNKYIMIQDPAYPNDETKRIWHPNMLIFYTEVERAQIKNLYDQFVSDYNFYSNFVVVNSSMFNELFDVKPKLDALVSSALSMVMSG
jgi:hypothetical protein